MDETAWTMYLLNLASFDNAARKPAIRSLFYAGREVDWIADAAAVDADFVRAALFNIP